MRIGRLDELAIWRIKTILNSDTAGFGALQVILYQSYIMYGGLKG